MRHACVAVVANGHLSVTKGDKYILWDKKLASHSWDAGGKNAASD